MRHFVETLAQLIAPLRAGLRRALSRAASLLLAVWRRANAIDLPLSGLQWILAFYLAFGVVYALATPIFEANDEIWHFGYVQHLRETGDLPRQVLDGRDTLFREHGSQPPLYYALAALLTSPISLDDIDDLRRLNPHARIGAPEAFGNKNLTIRDADHSPLAGASLAVTLLRGLGLALGAGTIVCVYKIGQLVAPQRPTVAFVAAAITGLNPMFIFVSASVSNDSLSAALNAALALLMLRMIRDGFAPRASLLIALLFALSGLTKVTGLLLLPVLLCLCLLAARKTGDRRGLVFLLAALAAFWLVIAGWWHLRNLQLYGEPLGLAMMANIAGTRGMTLDLADLLAEFQRFRMSYWGLFGALNIQLASVIYLLLDLTALLSVFGCVFLMLQLWAISDFAYARYELTHIAALSGAAVLLLLGLAFWSLQTPSIEGRMFFPLIAVASPLMAVGWVEAVWWLAFSLRPPNLEFVRAADAVPKQLLHETMLWQMRGLGLVALLAPLTVIASQYGQPAPVDAVPPNARTLYAEFGDVALIAYERSDRRYNAGERARVILYWQALAQSETDDEMQLRLVDDRGQEIGSYVSYPGAGRLRTSSWRAGAIYPDEYLITIHPGALGRFPFSLQVDWSRGKAAAPIAATDGAGRRIAPVRLHVGAVATARQQTLAASLNEIPADAQPVFDEIIRLEAFLLDLERNEISLSWKAEGSPSDNYTVFVHLLDAAGAILTQADATPRLPTKYWRWGETFTTHHQLPPMPNMLDHELIVGWYLNDGLTYPKLEYTLDPVDDPAPALAPGPPTPEPPPQPEAAGDEIAEDDPDLDDKAEPEARVFDSFRIPWDIAAEVIALTPTPEPEAETESDGADADESG